MQLSDFVKPVTNSTNNQGSFVLKKKALMAAGITASNLLDIKLPKELLSPKIKPAHTTTFKLNNLKNGRYSST